MMTKRMSSQLLNELNFFTEKLEVLKRSDEDSQFIVFMSELLERNIEKIQNKLINEAGDLKLNNKFMFLTTGKSLKLPEEKNEEQEYLDAETLKMMTIQPDNPFYVTGVTGIQGYGLNVTGTQGFF